MDLKVKDIANKLGITVEETLEMLELNGISILDYNKPLSARQKEKINTILLIQQNSINHKALMNQKSEEAIKYYSENYKIFIDTCSLMDIKIDDFYRNIYSHLKENSNSIIVPSRVIDELNKHVKSENKEKQKKAYKGLSILKKLQENNLLDIRGESSDNFADNVFLVAFTKFRIQYKLLLITQDNNLALEILNLNNSKSVKGNNVLVKRINRHGYLSNIENLKINNTNKINYRSQNHIKRTEIIDKFKLATEVRKYSNDTINVDIVPEENDILNSGSGKKIHLIKKLSAGGEGSVYITDTEYVAKIYKKDKITREKLEKIKLMISKKITYAGICWPVDILYNSNNEFVGYLMPRANGETMHPNFTIKPKLLKKGWKKRDAVELCVTILNKIEYLHKRNIILGDINPLNILIVSPKEVYFVDTDSYQIEGFTCPVGTINFTAQEILLEDNNYKRKYRTDRKYSDYLRTFENEYFAVAVLLFIIMLPGKQPYALQGGESPKENMLNMDFAYPLGDQSNGRTPDGPWKFIWSHMPYFIKEAFYETFRKDGDHSNAEDRLDVREWKVKMAEYLRLLDSGIYAKQDEMSEELFPTRRKKVKGIEYAKCRLCKSEEPEDSLKSGICRSCLKNGEIYKCSSCNKDMTLTNYDKYIKNRRKHDVCIECFEHANRVHSYINCVDCGCVFEITNKEYDYFISNGLTIPKRCKSCRENKKNTNRNTHSNSNQSNYSYDIGSSIGRSIGSILRNILNNR
ncbi:MAG: zinc-ribbon domain containing protein [Romboutsia sp.]